MSIRNLDKMFRPQSVAVIGASDKPHSVGSALMTNLTRAGFSGPIIPINAPLLALTPISPFRPRRWRGALLPDKAKITIEVKEADKRPVAAVADHDEVREVVSVDVTMDQTIAINLLFDPGHNLDERILREQFGV